MGVKVYAIRGLASELDGNEAATSTEISDVDNHSRLEERTKLSQQGLFGLNGRPNRFRSKERNEQANNNADKWANNTEKYNVHTKDYQEQAEQTGEDSVDATAEVAIDVLIIFHDIA